MKSATCLHRATCDLKDCRGEHATCYDPDMTIDDVAHDDLRLKQERDDYRAALSGLLIAWDTKSPLAWQPDGHAGLLGVVKDVLEKWGK